MKEDAINKRVRDEANSVRKLLFLDFQQQPSTLSP